MSIRLSKKHEQKVKQTQELKPRLKPSENIELNTGTTDIEPPDIPEPNSITEEDHAISDEKSANEAYSENSFTSVTEFNPELGVIQRIRKSFALVTTENGYRLLNFTNAKSSLAGLENIIMSFLPFEKITAEKLEGLAVDERTAKMAEESFSISKNIGSGYTLITPEGRVIPLHVLKRQKGKHEKEEHEAYRNFRLILFKYLKRNLYIKLRDRYVIDEDEYSKIVERISNGEDVLKVLAQGLRIEKSDSELLQECLNKSERARNSIEDIKKAALIYKKLRET